MENINNIAKMQHAEFQENQKLNLLEHFEKIVALSEKKGFTKVFFERSEIHLNYITQKLDISPLQAALFAHFLNKCDDQSIRIEDIASSIKCSKIRILQYMNEFDELEKKRLLYGCRERRGVSYRIPAEVINALRKGEDFKPEDHTNISITDMFNVIETLFEQRNENELTFDSLASELKSLIDSNMQLQFSQRIKKYELDAEDMVLLLCFCHLFVNNDDDNIGFHDIDDIYDHRATFRRAKRSLEDGDNELIARHFIENTTSEGFGDRDTFKLTDNTKKELLTELNIHQRQISNKKGLRSANEIPEKKLFYNEKEGGQIQKLCALLNKETFKSVQKRLSDSSMRTGFACLFSGPPGTGKTETVYQLARQTGRDLMIVDISETKSMWFGESEKRIKDIFNRYRVAVETNSIAPILLLNEADAVISKRKDLNNSSVAQTENTMQNIILQELESLEGILIATTNLTQNMDKAFERRFLYKIEFARPNLEARQSIWKTMIPEIAEESSLELAKRFDFSGGQIENIARKCTVDRIISGKEPSLEDLIAFCKEELLAKPEKPVGFLT